MSRPVNYPLRYVQAQEFYGYETPGAALAAAAEFSDSHNDTVFNVRLSWSEDADYSITVFWEDLSA